jgi:hypothetical protein
MLLGDICAAGAMSVSAVAPDGPKVFAPISIRALPAPRTPSPSSARPSPGVGARRRARFNIAVNRLRIDLPLAGRFVGGPGSHASNRRWWPHTYIVSLANPQGDESSERKFEYLYAVFVWSSAQLSQNPLPGTSWAVLLRFPRDDKVMRAVAPAVVLKNKKQKKQS